MHPAVFVESVPQESGATKVTRPLRARWRDMLVTGEHGYPSRSEAMSALTLAMVNSGWTWIEYHQAMTDPDLHKMAEYFYKRGAGPGIGRGVRATSSYAWSACGTTPSWWHKSVPPSPTRHRPGRRSPSSGLSSGCRVCPGVRR
jgi:hypothetical protein